MSLSARRAWIEMALIRYLINTYQSLSARRAWIEMEISSIDDLEPSSVALRKESVDRNISEDVSYNIIVSRSPQGERG